VIYVTGAKITFHNKWDFQPSNGDSQVIGGPFVDRFASKSADTARASVSPTVSLVSKHRATRAEALSDHHQVGTNEIREM
jgi:hypothetical protein